MKFSYSSYGSLLVVKYGFVFILRSFERDRKVGKKKKSCVLDC